MDKLEKLTQNNSGILHRSNGEKIPPQNAVTKGKIKTIVDSSPYNIDELIKAMTKKDSIIIPEGANAYVVSDWNPDTQFIKKTDFGSFFRSVFAVQFYYCNFLPD